MEGLLPILANLSLHWSWSARHIASTIPSTVHVLCYQTLPPDTWFHTFAVRGIPWTVHCNASEPYTLLNGNTVLILANNPEETTRSIRKASRVVGAFRARYFLIQYSNVDEKIIRNTVRLAWALHLTQVVVLRFEDRAIYAVLPKCSEPEIIKVSAVQWPNLDKIDWSTCTLKIAASNVPPFLFIDGGTDANISGYYVPFYWYAKSALKFKAIIIPTLYSNLTTKVMAGDVDVIFAPLFLAPNFPVELPHISATELMLCAPASCISASTSDLLWREFSASLWLLLAASVIAIIIAVRLVNPRNISTFVDSSLVMLSTLASVPAMLPHGHARGILASWLLAMLVLSTAYQTALHSMMTAPVFKHKIENAQDLINENIPLKCLYSSCLTFKTLAKTDAVLEELAARIEEMETSAGLRFIWSHQDTHAIYCSSYACNEYYTQMRGVLDKGVLQQYIGLFGYVPSSPLAPALRQLGGRSEASGLWSKWLPPVVRKPGCSASASRELQPISVAHLWPAMLLVCVGSTVALIAFLIELLWHRIEENTKLHCWNKRTVTTAQ